MTRRAPSLLLLTLVFVLGALALSACGAGQPSSPMSWETQAAPMDYAVVCDVTQSTLGARDEYVDGLVRVLEGLGHGDRLVVMSAEDSSVQNSELWLEEELPSYAFTPSPRPETDNELLLDAWQKKEQQRYENGMADFAAAHDLGAWRQDALKRVQGKVHGRVAAGTDLAGALYLAGQLLGSASCGEERRLVLFTDGLIQTPAVDWRGGAVTSGAVERLVREQRRAGALPDLAGVTVILIGARAENEKRLAALRGAWSRYVSACGGRLDPRFFMSHLSETLYGEWLGEQEPQGGA